MVRDEEPEQDLLFLFLSSAVLSTVIESDESNWYLVGWSRGPHYIGVALVQLQNASTFEIDVAPVLRNLALPGFSPCLIGPWNDSENHCASSLISVPSKPCRRVIIKRSIQHGWNTVRKKKSSCPSDSMVLRSNRVQIILFQPIDVPQQYFIHSVSFSDILNMAAATGSSRLYLHSPLSSDTTNRDFLSDLCSWKGLPENRFGGGGGGGGGGLEMSLQQLVYVNVATSILQSCHNTVTKTTESARSGNHQIPSALNSTIYHWKIDRIFWRVFYVGLILVGVASIKMCKLFSYGTPITKADASHTETDTIWCDGYKDNSPAFRLNGTRTVTQESNILTPSRHSVHNLRYPFANFPSLAWQAVMMKVLLSAKLLVLMMSRLQRHREQSISTDAEPSSVIIQHKEKVQRSQTCWPEFLTFTLILASLAVDSLMGILSSCILLCLPRDFIGSTVSTIVWKTALDERLQGGSHTLVSPVSRLLVWLTQFPLGLKLNRCLGQFLINVISSTIQLWLSFLLKIHQILPIKSIGIAIQIAGFVCGFSLQLAIVFDVFQFMTLQVLYVYLVFGRLLNLCTSSLRSLWLLFQGRKWNVLRHRVDSITADLDQLITGTILFTVVACLTPTVAAFYYSCLPLWLTILSFQVLYVIFMISIHNLPMYFILNVSKSPLTDGLSFKTILPSHHSNNCEATTPLSERTSSFSISSPLHLQLIRLPSYSVFKNVFIDPVQWTFSSLISAKTIRRLFNGLPVHWFMNARPINEMLLYACLPCSVANAASLDLPCDVLREILEQSSL